MKRSDKAPSRGLWILYRILMVTAIALALSLCGGTLYVLASRDRSPNPLPDQSRDQAPPSGSGPSERITSERIFAGIGRLRLSTAPPQPATVILSVTFPYNPEDKAFSGELASRIRDLRDITADYFAALQENELRSRDEGAIKSELLGRYNAILRLGQIPSLFFDDYMIIE